MALKMMHRVRSSNPFILSVVIIALFCDIFIYSFPVPILSYMIEDRLHIDPSQTQNYTTALLGLHGFTTLIAAPIIAHFADKSPARKLPFLASLAGCFVGTLLLSLTPSIPALFVGRVLQAVAGSATWIVGSATLNDNVEVQNLGKLYGVAMSFVSAGVVAGPAVAGTVLELAGYWTAWSIPLGLLALDLVMRSVMIESSKQPSNNDVPSPANSSEGEETALLGDDDANQASSLGSISPPPEIETSPILSKPPAPRRNFYLIMFSDARILVGLTNTILSSALLASFDTTLTLHLRDAFGWGSLEAGMMFFSLQLPFMILGPIAGWIRDRVGLRYPTTIGWAILAPVMWLIGVPGGGVFPSDSVMNTVEMYVGTIVALGVVAPFVRGAGYLQLSLVLKDLESNDPEIFGQHGGGNRVFALQDIALSLGLMVGPLISGSLTQLVGYYWVSCIFAAQRASTSFKMQGFNMGRYVPPDLEGTITSGNALHKKHPLGNRARHLHGGSGNGSLIVRFEMPFATWCTTCKPENIIGQGVRFNAEKKKVGNYYSTPVYSFRFKHTACGGWIEIRTDPRNTAYVVTEGGRRRDYGVDEAGNAVGEIMVGRAEPGADDPFAKIEGKVEDKRVVDEARARILELQRRQDRDWDDPYEISRRLRRGFRAERKVLEKKEEGKEAIRDKMSLGIEIVDEIEEDRVRASMVDFEGQSGFGLGGNKGGLRTRALFEKAPSASASSSSVSVLGASANGVGSHAKNVKGKSGKRKAADLVADRKALFRSELTGNTRAAVDPFLNGADGWQAGGKKRKAVGKGEGNKEGDRAADGDVQAASGDTVQNHEKSEEKIPSTSALVDYGSDSE
ncbi:hypothetical protein HK57_00246 [Aspergillus ustus]|uniref:Major facilitator superfamily (MFS) profile domain-containing protein n=1 Tax=Aspergillus ustus TaxID=40382 RepID=A0A0C1EGZ7_ASPUT|nr:hypothetical protein HK57_00246 [Aspergillus ustus]